MDFLTIADATKDELIAILELATQLKQELKNAGQNQPLLERQTLAMIFEKPSLRTRISFEIGMTQLGGHAIYLGPSDIQLGKRESAADVGRVTGSMADIIMARTFSHDTVVELAAGSEVPVINGLSDLEHPCQILADYLTIQEIFGTLSGLKLAFVGDGNNNVTQSLAVMSALMGNSFAVAAPKGYEMAAEVRQQVQQINAQSHGELIETTDPVSAVAGADVVIADTWVSMGSEQEAEERLRVFQPYQVSTELMKQASKKSIFMHCLPAYRGKEVEAAVIDGPQSVIFQEAENRLHAQKGLLVFLSQK